MRSLQHILPTVVAAVDVSSALTDLWSKSQMMTAMMVEISADMSSTVLATSTHPRESPSRAIGIGGGAWPRKSFHMQRQTIGSSFGMRKCKSMQVRAKNDT